MAHVEAARSDGRWAAAYTGSATMVMPEDFFLAALQLGPTAYAFYGTLKRQSLFTIHHRLQRAKRAETREKRMLAKLGRGESPQRAAETYGSKNELYFEECGTSVRQIAFLLAACKARAQSILQQPARRCMYAFLTGCP